MSHGLFASAQNLRRMQRSADELPSFDFTLLSLGAASLPAGLTLERDSIDSVQIGTSSVAVGLPAHAARVGRRLDADLPGLVIEESRTNLCVTPRALVGTGWAAGSGGTRIAAVDGSVVSPDGSTKSDSYSTPNGSTYSNYYTRVNADGVVQISLWLKASASGFTSKTQLGTANSSFSVTTAWQRFSAEYNTAVSGTTYYITPLNQGGTAQAAGIDLMQIEVGAFPTEWIPGGSTRAGDRLRATKRLEANGRLALEVEFRPKGSRSAYGGAHIVYVDASDRVSIAGATGIITCVIGGVSYSTPLGADWNAHDTVRIWIEIGADLPSLVAYQVNEAEPDLLSVDPSPTSLGAWTLPTCDLMNGGGSAQLSCWLLSVKPYSVSGSWS